MINTWLIFILFPVLIFTTWTLLVVDFLHNYEDTGLSIQIKIHIKKLIKYAKHCINN